MRQQRIKYDVDDGEKSDNAAAALHTWSDLFVFFFLCFSSNTISSSQRSVNEHHFCIIMNMHNVQKQVIVSELYTTDAFYL